jgi:hypothetical protein
MKARDYVKMYRDEVARGNEHACAKVGSEFIAETVRLKDVRHVSSIGGFEGILKEQDQKWRAFVRLAGVAALKPDGFENLIEYWLRSRNPELWELLSHGHMEVYRKRGHMRQNFNPQEDGGADDQK